MADLTSGSSIIRFLLFAGTGIALFGAGATFVLLSEPASDTSIMLTKFVLAGFVACASIFATVIKVMASRGLVRRVAELTTAICQGTEGNLTVQVAVASDDELGHLGKTVNSLFNKFGKMVLQINDTISELGKISDQPRFSISVYVWLNRQDRRSRGICPQSCKPCSFPPGH